MNRLAMLLWRRCCWLVQWPSWVLSCSSPLNSWGKIRLTWCEALCMLCTEWQHSRRHLVLWCVLTWASAYYSQGCSWQRWYCSPVVLFSRVSLTRSVTLHTLSTESLSLLHTECALYFVHCVFSLLLLSVLYTLCIAYLVCCILSVLYTLRIAYLVCCILSVVVAGVW